MREKREENRTKCFISDASQWKIITKDLKEHVAEQSAGVRFVCQLTVAIDICISSCNVVENIFHWCQFVAEVRCDLLVTNRHDERGEFRIFRNSLESNQV